MKTKLIKTFLLGFVTLGMLAGCTNDDSSSASSSDNANQSQSSSSISYSATPSDSSDAGSSPSSNPSSGSSAATSSSSSAAASNSSAAASSSSAPASSTASSSSSSSSSQAANNKAFPVAMIANYFAGEGVSDVDIPALVAPDNSTGFTIRDGMMGGVMVEVSCSRDDMLAYFQEFFDTGWFVCRKIGNNDEWVMNFLGFTEAYVDFWFNRMSISFDFFVEEPPEEDPSLDPDMGPLSAEYPFPSNQVNTVVYAPNNITVAFPDFKSKTTEFSAANPVQGTSLMITARNFPDDEKTALLAAFVECGWALKDGSTDTYKYSTTRAIFQVAGNARMFMMTFKLDD